MNTFVNDGRLSLDICELDGAGWGPATVEGGGGPAVVVAADADAVGEEEEEASVEVPAPPRMPSNEVRGFDASLADEGAPDPDGFDLFLFTLSRGCGSNDDDDDV